MYFIGDVHGKIKEFGSVIERILPDCKDDELIIQVGDMACGYPGIHVPGFPPRVRWIRGNHDNPSKSREHPNYMGDWGYDVNRKLFWLAGAWSIDRDVRLRWEREGGPKTWWPDEQLSQEELDRALALYIETKPEIVVSHEAPASVVPEVLWTDTVILSIQPGDPTHSPEMTKLRAETGYYQRKEKLGCVETRTSQTLQRMLNHRAPKHWVFGHYHISKEIKLGDTTFKCVAELEPYRVIE